MFCPLKQNLQYKKSHKLALEISPTPNYEDTANKQIWFQYIVTFLPAHAYVETFIGGFATARTHYIKEYILSQLHY